MRGSVALARRARALGVATRYEDAGGVLRAVPDTTVEDVCDLIEPSAGGTDTSGEGAGRPEGSPGEVVVVRGGRITSGLPPGAWSQLSGERLVLEDGGESSLAALPLEELPLGIHRLEWCTDEGCEGCSTVIVSPQRFPALRATDRPVPGVAVFVPMYALWSTGQPAPSYELLVNLTGSLAAAHSAAGVPADAGVECIATLPLFAPGLGSRFDPSPYSPVSRFHLNEVYAAWSTDRGDGALRGASRGGGGLVDWPTVAGEALDRLKLRADDLTGSERNELGAFLSARPDVSSYARFCSDGEVPAAVHEVGQWLAERSLGATVAELHERGIRLAADLPVGSRPGGWEQHRWPDLFVADASIGAPPDSFFGQGQDWGLAPVNPLAARREGHRMWHDLLANAARHADVLRIDHVMQVLRLFWVPAGAAATEGTYVAYPANELLAVAALVAERSGTVLIGEDLGTVPPEMVALMRDWRLPGMHEEAFSLHDLAADETAAGASSREAPARAVDEEPTRDLPAVPAGSWAGLRTHDMSPMAALVAEVDTGPYRRALEADLGHPVPPGEEALCAAMLERLARSGAGEIVIDLHDALGSSAPHNVPGTVTGENWSSRLPVAVEDLADDPGLQRTLAALRSTTGQP